MPFCEHHLFCSDGGDSSALLCSGITFTLNSRGYSFKFENWLSTLIGNENAQKKSIQKLLRNIVWIQISSQTKVSSVGHNTVW